MEDPLKTSTLVNMSDIHAKRKVMGRIELASEANTPSPKPPSRGSGLRSPVISPPLSGRRPAAGANGSGHVRAKVDVSSLGAVTSSASSSTSAEAMTLPSPPITSRTRPMSVHGATYPSSSGRTSPSKLRSAFVPSPSGVTSDSSPHTPRARPASPSKLPIGGTSQDEELQSPYITVRKPRTRTQSTELLPTISSSQRPANSSASSFSNLNRVTGPRGVSAINGSHARAHSIVSSSATSFGSNAKILSPEMHTYTRSPSPSERIISTPATNSAPSLPMSGAHPSRVASEDSVSVRASVASPALPRHGGGLQSRRISMGSTASSTSSSAMPSISTTSGLPKSSHNQSGSHHSTEVVSARPGLSGANQIESSAGPRTMPHVRTDGHPQRPALLSNWSSSEPVSPALLSPGPTAINELTPWKASLATEGQATPALLSPTTSDLLGSGGGPSTSTLSPAVADAALEAKRNRKILDLEITNKSLLAINAGLEVTKVKQAREIRELKRRLRDVLSGSGVGSTTGTGLDDENFEEDETDDEDDDDDGSEVILKEDEELEAAHGRCKGMIDAMVQRAREAILSEYIPDELGRGGNRVLHAAEIEAMQTEGDGGVAEGSENLDQSIDVGQNKEDEQSGLLTEVSDR